MAGKCVQRLMNRYQSEMIITSKFYLISNETPQKNRENFVMNVTSHFLCVKTRLGPLFFETKIKNSQANTHARLKISGLPPI